MFEEVQDQRGSGRKTLVVLGALASTLLPSSLRAQTSDTPHDTPTAEVLSVDFEQMALPGIENLLNPNPEQEILDSLSLFPEQKSSDSISPFGSSNLIPDLNLTIEDSLSFDPNTPFDPLKNSTLSYGIPDTSSESLLKGLSVLSARHTLEKIKAELESQKIGQLKRFALLEGARLKPELAQELSDLVSRDLSEENWGESLGTIRFDGTKLRCVPRHFKRYEIPAFDGTL